MRDSNNNIKFEYLYRDAGNYKLYNSVIFSNKHMNNIDDIETKIRNKLIDGEFFIPEAWKIKRLGFENYDSESDHVYHEFIALTQTDKLPTEKEDIFSFLQRI
jgi:hypothetical protein